MSLQPPEACSCLVAAPPESRVSRPGPDLHAAQLPGARVTSMQRQQPAEHCWVNSKLWQRCQDMSVLLSARAGITRWCARTLVRYTRSCPMVGSVEVQDTTSASDTTSSAGPPCARTAFHQHTVIVAISAFAWAQKCIQHTSAVLQRNRARKVNTCKSVGLCTCAHTRVMPERGVLRATFTHLRGFNVAEAAAQQLLAGGEEPKAVPKLSRIRAELLQGGPDLHAKSNVEA